MPNRPPIFMQTSQRIAGRRSLHYAGRRMPLKRATDSAARATGTIERFIERTLAPRLEELAGEMRGMRATIEQLDKRMTENNASLRAEIGSVRNEIGSVRNEIASLRSEMQAEIGSVRNEMGSLRTEMQAEIGSLRREMQTEIGSVRTEIGSLRSEMQAELRTVRTEVEATRVQLATRIDAQGQRLDDALNVRERIVALEAKLAARAE